MHDFIHGDLHPGNILVSGTYPNLNFQVLDCGLALEMGPRQHENIVKVLGAFTRKDGRAAGQTMVDMRSESQATEEGKELFIKGIEQICVLDDEQNFIENVGDYITDICSLACIHRVKLEGAFVNASLAVEIMEGLASALDPSLRVQQVALPLVVKAEMMVSACSAPSAREENLRLVHVLQFLCVVRRDEMKVSHRFFFFSAILYSIDWDGIKQTYQRCCYIC